MPFVTSQTSCVFQSHFLKSRETKRSKGCFSVLVPDTQIINIRETSEFCIWATPRVECVFSNSAGRRTISQTAFDRNPGMSTTKLPSSDAGPVSIHSCSYVLIIRSLAFCALCLAIRPIDLLLQVKYPIKVQHSPICNANDCQQIIALKKRAK